MKVNLRKRRIFAVKRKMKKKTKKEKEAKC